MIDLTEFYSRKYDIDHYNCSHFLNDVWKAVDGIDRSDLLCGTMRPIDQDKGFFINDLRQFKKIKKPESPCMVLLHSKHQSPHVGLFYCNRVFHLSVLGPQCVRLQQFTSGFDRVSFYK